MTLSAEKSGVPMGFAAKVGFDSSCGGRKMIKKKMDLDPMRFISIFLPPLWLEWLEYFVSISFFQASFTTSKSKFLGITLEKEARGSINLTCEFLCTTRCFRRFYFTARKETFPPMKNGALEISGGLEDQRVTAPKMG